MSISGIEHAETELRPLRNIVHTSVQKLGQGLVAPLAEFWGKLDSESRRISKIFEILNPLFIHGILLSLSCSLLHTNILIS
jgi:hypothetical protein